jgi:hypothetical protein
MPNPNDGTILGSNEVISDEYIDPSTATRLDPNVPPTGYKLPRSKIAIGVYGQDGGDATADNPLPAESRTLRQLAELTQMRDRENALRAYVKVSAEYLSLVDNRGHHLSTRGVR